MSQKEPEFLRYSWIKFTKTDWLSMVFGRDDRYYFSYWLCVKSLIQVENHLHSFHRNSSTIAG